MVNDTHTGKQHKTGKKHASWTVGTDDGSSSVGGLVGWLVVFVAPPQRESTHAKAELQRTNERGRTIDRS